MQAQDRDKAERGEAFLSAYLRGSALLEDLDELGLHQAAAHLSLALEVMGRTSAPSVRDRLAGGAAEPRGGVVELSH
jgi:hypothetical protein